MISEKQIKKWNKKFRSLSKAEKRVAIAKDVIAQVKANKVIPHTGIYCHVDMNSFPESYLEDIDAQKHFDKIECRACALGSMVVSMVKYTDDATVRDIHYAGLTDWEDDIMGRLSKYFTKGQLFQIEALFENENFDEYEIENREGTGYVCGNGYKPPRKLFHEVNRVVESTNWKSKYPKERLLSLMRNIIRNNGELVLSDYK